MKITVQSKSGELAFDCGARESILHAGLRHGINLPYECASGTCGTCRARLVTGEVDIRWKEAPGAARLKSEKGDMLMCQTRARSDCVLKVPSQLAISEEFRPLPRRGVIRDFKNLTNDVVQFDVQLSETMTFESGQFVVIETADVSGARAYSMVNFAVDTDRIALVMKRKPSGRFSDWLFGHPEDAEVEVFGPLGQATFDPAEGKNIICIAGGSGIAGIMSILERAVQANYFREHKGAVFFGVRTLADTFYLEPLSRYVAVSHGNLEVTVALSHEQTSSPNHADFPTLNLANGMVHEVAAQAIAAPLDDAIAYVAGPPIMVDSAIRALIVGGLSSRDIRYDKFS